MMVWIASGHRITNTAAKFPAVLAHAAVWFGFSDRPRPRPRIREDERALFVSSARYHTKGRSFISDLGFWVSLDLVRPLAFCLLRRSALDLRQFGRTKCSWRTAGSSSSLSCSSSCTSCCSSDPGGELRLEIVVFVVDVYVFDVPSEFSFCFFPSAWVMAQRSIAMITNMEQTSA